MSNVIYPFKTQTQKYTEALAKQEGTTIETADLLGCDLYNYCVESMIQIIGSTQDTTRAHEIILGILARLLAKAQVSADIGECPIEFDNVLKLADREYTKAIQEWLDDGFTTLQT